MNREIKYRGLTSNRAWVYGNLIQGKNGICYICSINENPIYKNGDSWYIDSPCYKVIPETVGQYTGLKNKHAKDIYEGDIVVKKDKDWFFTDDWEEDDIRWEDTDLNIPLKEVNRDYVTLERFGYWLKNESFGYEGEDLQNSSDYETIGNIFDNPELLTI